jgi:hypothetical protein
MTATAVSRSDIEAKLRQIDGEVHQTASDAAPVVLAAAAAAVVLVIGAVYLLGRRRGRKRSTVVEIKRI